MLVFFSTLHRGDAACMMSTVQALQDRLNMMEMSNAHAECAIRHHRVQLHQRELKITELQEHVTQTRAALSFSLRDLMKARQLLVEQVPLTWTIPFPHLKSKNMLTT